MADIIFVHIKTNILVKTPSHTIVIDEDGTHEYVRPESERERRLTQLARIERWLLQGVMVVTAMLLEELKTMNPDTFAATSGDPAVTTSGDPVTCCVCLEPMAAANPLPCPQCSSGTNTESIHVACLTQWTITQGNGTCPMCRFQLTPVDEDRQYAANPPQTQRTLPGISLASASTPSSPLEMAQIALAEAIKCMKMGIGAARSLPNFSRHMLIDTEIDNLMRSAPFEHSRWPRQNRPLSGISASTGRTNYFGNHHIYTALEPFRFTPALIQDAANDDLPYGMHLQVIHEPERSHWVLLAAWFNGFQSHASQVVILDSSRMERPAVNASPSVQIAARMVTWGVEHGDTGVVSFTTPPCAQQTGGVECGLFACANYYLAMAGTMNPFAAPHEADAPCTFKYDTADLYEWYMRMIRDGEWERRDTVSGGYACIDMPPPPHIRLLPRSRLERFPDSVHTSNCQPSSRRISKRQTKGKRNK